MTCLIQRTLFRAPCLAGWLWTLAAGAAEPAPPITSFAEYHQAVAQREQRHRPFTVEASVLYYDATWRVIFLQDDTAGFYLDAPAAKLPLYAGARVRLSGTFERTEKGARLASPDFALLPDAPLPEPRTANLAELSAANLANRWVATTGTIRWVRVLGDVLEGGLVDGPNEAVFCWREFDRKELKEWIGARVALTGAAAEDGSGPVRRSRLFVPRNGDLQVLSLPAVNAFEGPPRLIDTVRTNTQHSVAHVLGAVVSQRDRITLRDESGEIRIRASHPIELAEGSLAETVGRLVLTDGRLEIVDAVILPASASTLGAVPTAAQLGPDRSLPVIQRIDEVRALNQAEASRRYPVKVSGVVTYRFASWNELFLQDASAGIYVDMGQLLVETAAGDRVEIEGFTDPGGYAPMIRATRFTRQGTAELPPATLRSLPELLTGNFDSQWVEAVGVVQSATNTSDGVLEARLRNQAGTFGLRLPYAVDVRKLVDSVVRARGVVASTYNANRELTHVEVRVPTADHLTIEHGAPADPFDLPASGLGDLRQFRPAGDAPTLVKVWGVVTSARPDGSFHLQDDQRATLVVPRDPHPRQAGELVEAVGYFEMHQSSSLLVEALVRPAGTRSLPAPRAVDARDLVREDVDQMRVRLSGRFAGRIHRGASQVTLLQVGNWIVEASTASAPNSSEAPPLGALVECQGVLVFHRDLLGRIQGVTLELDPQAAPVVLERPSAWTRGRIQAVVAALLLALGVGSWRYRSTAAVNRQLRREIAERRDAELRLKRNQYLLRTLMEHSPDFIYLKDPDGRFLLVNRAISDKFNFSKPELLTGLTDFDLFDEASARQFRADELEVMRTGQAIVAKEEREEGRDGKVRWMETTTIPHYDENGTLCGVMGFARDITARKEADDELNRQKQLHQVIFDAMPALVMYKDTCNRVLRVNRFGAELLGLPRHEIEGKSLFEIDPEHAAQFYEDDLEILRSGQGKPGIEEIVGTADGRTVWLRTDKLPDRDTRGQIKGVVVFAVDVTAQKLAETELNHAREQLEHQIRERTAALERQSCQRLQAEADSAEQKQFSRTLLDALPHPVLVKDRDGRITMFNRAAGDLLQRPEAEILQRTAADLGWERDSIRALQREEQSLWRRQETREAIEERLQDRAGKTRWLRVNRQPLLDDTGTMHRLLVLATDITESKRRDEAVHRQITHLQAALDYLPTAVFLKEAASLHYVLCNRAAEQLTGVAANNLAGRHNGELFGAEIAEASHSHDRTALQSGVVLEVAAEAFGTPDGTIRWMRTRRMPIADPDGRFRYLLITGETLAVPGDRIPGAHATAPAQPDDAARDNPEAGEALRHTSSEAPRLRGLVAAHDAAQRETASAALHQLGYDADCVANGREVLSAIESILYDVILMDCELRELDGFAATRAVRDRAGGGSQPYIIALVDDVRAASKQCRAAGMDAWVNKPVCPASLRDALAARSDHDSELKRPSSSSPTPKDPAARPDGARTAYVDAEAIARLRELGEPGGPDLAVEFINLYVTDGRAMLEKMRGSLAAADGQLLKRQAHTLKGSSRNMGAETVADVAKEIETVATVRSAEELARLVEELDQAFSATVPLLEAHKQPAGAA